MRKKQVKLKTTLGKVRKGRLKSTELPVRGGTQDSRDASQVPSPSGSQCGRDVLNNGLTGKTFVPVVDKEGKPLMPTSPARANQRSVPSDNKFLAYNKWCLTAPKA